ncbi:MAG TPA: TonB-dependent receptor [Bacteroidia bacterium]|nr:TonB-dependent receptor [Bacteroidia bacterium]
MLLNPFMHAHADSGVKGSVHSAEYSETITGALVFDINDPGHAVVSDADGNYSLNLVAGQHTLLCVLLGMKTDTFIVHIAEGSFVQHNILLQPLSKLLDAVVVSAGKYEQKLEELTVSMELVKPALMESKNTTNISTVLNSVPGLTVLDGEPQIRSGSGFSFGVGSRVGILIDDIPILVGDQGRPEWSFIPIENVEQIEIIKGASSVLYGSSALSGIIHVRTTYPKEKTQTKAELYYGQYDAPDVAGAKWWKGAASQSGFSFLHSTQLLKKRNLDFTISGRVLQDHNFIGPALPVKYIAVPVDTTLSDKDVGTRLGRVNLSVRYRPEKIKGLAFGIIANVFQSHDNFTLIWLNDSSGMYRAFPGTMTISKSNMYYVDPFLTYFSRSGLKHELHARIFGNDVNNSNSQSNASTVMYGEYRLSKELIRLKSLRFTGGLVYNGVSSHAELYSASGHPDNTMKNYSGYAQFEKKLFDLIHLSAGYRGEYFSINNENGKFHSLLRGGLSVAISKGTFFRASYGEGYRYPTITEKFIFTSVGGISVFPNPDLKPETSNSAEIGLKQGFKIRNVYGFIDASVFQEYYYNTIEYTYALWRPDSAGFKFVNTGKTRVRGIEFTLAGKGKLSKDWSLTFMAGYMSTLPEALEREYIYAVDNPSPGFIPTQLSYLSTSTDTTDNILKYRFKKTIKGDIEITWRMISLGFSVNYYSFMQNIDKVFYDIDVPYRLPTGIRKYREDHHKGTTVCDARIRVDVNTHFSLSLISANVGNLSYSLRPLKIESPRTIQMQLTAKF